jgi:hypothetical protein
MISISFIYPKDPDLKIDIHFDHWFSRQKDFTLWVNGEKLEESEPGSEIFVALVGEKLFAIRYHQDRFVPRLVIEKEAFSIGKNLKWIDYLIGVVYGLAFLFLEKILLKNSSVVLILAIPSIYFVGRYLSISQNPMRRWKIGLPSLIVLVFSILWIFCPQIKSLIF